MTPDAYIRSIIRKYQIKPEQKRRIEFMSKKIYPIIRRWAHEHLIRIKPIGSFAKNTNILGNSDLDLFISLRHTTPSSLRDIFANLSGYLELHNFSVKEQNVSVNININKFSIDLVPGKKQEGLTSDHSIYSRKSDSWIKTNVYKNISYVKKANCRLELITFKIWKFVNKIEFPSVYLELSIIDALKGYRKSKLSKTLLHLFEYLYNDFETIRIIDPANSNNIVSDCISLKEKQNIKKAAYSALTASSWEKIIW